VGRAQRPQSASAPSVRTHLPILRGFRFSFLRVGRSGLHPGVSSRGKPGIETPPSTRSSASMRRDGNAFATCGEGNGQAD
jgi:hypothetical protein